MSEPMNHLEIESRVIDMQPISLPPLTAHFNMLHEQVTWLTKELDAFRHENEWI